MILHSFSIGAALTITACLQTALPQEADEAWKSLTVQGGYLQKAGNYAQAEQILLKAVHEAERFGPEDSRVGTTLNALGLCYRDEKKYNEAETAFRKANAILDHADGSDSRDVADVNLNIASVAMAQGHYTEALPYLQKTLASYENLLDGNSVETAAVLCALGDAYRLSKDYKAAEAPLRRCADIREADGGLKNSDLADAMHSLALTYAGEGKYALAEPRFTMAEKIRENTSGITSPELAQTMEDHAALLKQMGRDKEAARLKTMAASIRRNQKKR